MIAMGTRIRHSPYAAATAAAGADRFDVCNRMLVATGFGDPLAEYWRLIRGVAVWDIACQRQIELAGADAARLAQMLSVRHVSGMPAGSARYVPICDHRGVLIGDAVLLRLDEDRFWLSIADCDLGLWARAIAAERRLSVTVAELEVAPLAVQGPLADDVVARLVDPSVRDLARFRFRDVEIDGISVTLMRGGGSGQGGFELFLHDPDQATRLWDAVMAAGAGMDIGPGGPNLAARIESGLMTFGADTDDATTPTEVRLGRLVDLDVPDDTIGIRALRRQAERGAPRHQIGVVLDGPLPDPTRRHAVFKGATEVGMATSLAWSPRLEAAVGLCLVWTGAGPGDAVRLRTPGGWMAGELRDLPLL